MKKTTLYLSVLFLVLLSCKKEDSKILVPATYFELGDCFSTHALANQQRIIRDQESYKAFEDEIRRHFFVSCDTVFLPAIDFDNYFFMGYYSATSGCEANYDRSIYYLFNNNYEYNIHVSSMGACEMILTSFNGAVVPLQSDSVVVNFNLTIQ